MERADSRCLTPVQTELVGGQRVALWKGEPDPEEVSLNWVRSTLIALVSIAAVVALSRWILVRTEAGDFLPSRIFAVVAMASPLLILALILWKQRRRRPENEPMVPSCREIPGAVPVRVALSNGQSSRGASYGWLSVSDGRLTFQGEFFDFALRPEDFKSSKDLLSRLISQGERVVTPDGVSDQRIRIRFLARDGEKWIDSGETQERFQRTFEPWLASRPGGRSLFPPLRYSNTPIRLRGLFLGFGGIGLILALFIWQLPHILGTAVFEGRSTLGMAAAVFAFMLFIPVNLLMVAKGKKPFDGEVDKVLERERKGMATPSE